MKVVSDFDSSLASSFKKLTLWRINLEQWVVFSLQRLIQFGEIDANCDLSVGFRGHYHFQHTTLSAHLPLKWTQV